MALTERDLKQLSVRGVAGVVANFHKANMRIQRGARRVTVESMRRAKRYARSICPVDTKRMKNSIRATPSPQRLTYELDYDPEPYRRDGVPFYPVYVELGTSRMGARPVLFLTKLEEDPVYRREITAMLRAELR